MNINCALGYHNYVSIYKNPVGFLGVREHNYMQCSRCGCVK